MNNLHMGPGTLFIGLPGEDAALLGEIKEATLEPAMDELENHWPDYVRPFDPEPASLTVTVKLKGAQWLNLLYGLHGTLALMFDLCPRRRVVHLTRYGKKKRTRKKNLRRMLRLLEKEAKR